MVYCSFHHFVMATNPLRTLVASENQLSQPKMCKNQKYASQIVHSTVYTLPAELAFLPVNMFTWLLGYSLHSYNPRE